MAGNLGYSLKDLVGAVQDVAPNRSVDSLKRWTNKRIRQVTTRRAWSDLISLVNVNFVAPYNTGLVNMTTGSTVVTGTGPDASGNYASFPVADYIDTTSGPQGQIRQAGYQRVWPASMQGIIPGQWLLIDTGGSYPEVVNPVWTDAVSFIADFQYPHNINYTIQASSFAGLQLQPGYPLSTITAVINATTLWIDKPWAGPPLTNQTYNILTAYFSPTPTCWRLKFANDPVQGCPLDVDNQTYESILIGDPQLSSSANPAVVVPLPSIGGGGVTQFMAYPLILAPYYLNVIAVNSWPKLVQDQDRSPNFLDAEMFIAGVKSDSLRTKVIGERGQNDPFYDPAQADHYEKEFLRYLEAAEERDESLSHHRLQTYMYQISGTFSAAYQQSHPGWPTDWPQN